MVTQKLAPHETDSSVISLICMPGAGGLYPSRLTGPRSADRPLSLSCPDSVCDSEVPSRSLVVLERVDSVSPPPLRGDERRVEEAFLEEPAVEFARGRSVAGLVGEVGSGRVGAARLMVFEVAI